MEAGGRPHGECVVRELRVATCDVGDAGKVAARVGDGVERLLDEVREVKNRRDHPEAVTERQRVAAHEEALAVSHEVFGQDATADVVVAAAEDQQVEADRVGAGEEGKLEQLAPPLPLAEGVPATRPALAAGRETGHGRGGKENTCGCEGLTSGGR